MNNPIVQRALELSKKHPKWSSLQVLDVAMDGHVNTHPDFEVRHSDQAFSDWLDPPSPFSQLLKGAFGAHVEAEEFDARAERWQEVIDAFASRYQLWR